MQEKIMKFKQLLERELEAEFDKISNNGTITPDSICTLKDAVKLMLMLNEYEESGGSESSYGYSSRRGRSRTTGRYVSRDGGSFGSYDGSYRGSYGGYSGHDQIIERLEMMRGEAHDEKERKMIDEWIRSAEASR